MITLVGMIYLILLPAHVNGEMKFKAWVPVFLYYYFLAG